LLKSPEMQLLFISPCFTLAPLLLRITNTILQAVPLA